MSHNRCCNCEGMPVGAQCYAVVSICADQDPSTVYPYPLDDLLAIGLDWTVGSVIETSTGDCLAIQGTYYRPLDEDLPAWFSTLDPPVGSPVAILESCLESPCDLVPNVACPSCVLPDRCVQQGVGLLFDSWDIVFGYDAWCVRGAVLVARVGWNGTSRRTDGSLSRVQTESVNYEASSRTTFTIGGGGGLIISTHSMTASGSYTKTDSLNPGTDESESWSETQNSSTPDKTAAIFKISQSPFPIGGLVDVPPSFGSDSAITVSGLPGGFSCGSSDVEQDWDQSVEDGPASAEWSCNGSTEADCSTYTVNSSRRHNATIGARYGSASFTYSSSTRYRRRYKNRGPGCDFAPSLNSDDTDGNFTFSESRQVFWRGPGSPTLPDLDAGCPLIVQGFACDDLSVEILVNVDGLLPLPGAVTVDYGGTPRRFNLGDTLMMDDGSVYTPVGVHNNCDDTTPPPALMAPETAAAGGGGLRAVAGGTKRAAPARTKKLPGEKPVLARIWDAHRMAASYTRALASGRDASPQTISLRQLSCFGDEDQGIAACDYLRGEPGARWCGACGCGRLAAARLDPNAQGESKLQHTYLECPLGRDGFSNAQTGETPDEGIGPV